MKTSKLTLLASNLALTVAVAVLAGCASHNYDKGTATAAGLKESADKISAADGQLNATLASLNNLVERPQADLRPGFETFATALDRLQSLDKDVNDKATDMQAKGQDYFAEWNQQLATIRNEDIRARSAERQQAVTARFQTINSHYQEANAAFKPLMSDLQDIRTALSNDLTAGGIAAIRKTVAKANQEAPPIKKTFGKLSADFKALGLSLSAVTPASK